MAVAPLEFLAIVCNSGWKRIVTLATLDSSEHAASIPIYHHLHIEVVPLKDSSHQIGAIGL